MKITENFIGVVDKIKYSQCKNVSKYKKEGDADILYFCNITINEVGKGMVKFPQRHNVVIDMTAQQFDEKPIEKGDRIKILAGAKWKSSPLNYKSYANNVIEKADKSQLKVDSKGKVYWEMHAYAYTIQCKFDNWEMESKFYNQNYCTIFNSGIHLPLERKDCFKDSVLTWVIDEKEKEQIKPFDSKVCRIILYSNKNKAQEKEMLVELKFDDENKTNYLQLSEVENAS